MNDQNKKIILKLAVYIVIFFVFVMLVFNYGMNFYNRIKCSSRKTLEKMLEYCQSTGNYLKDVIYEDGLCVGICGK